MEAESTVAPPAETRSFWAEWATPKNLITLLITVILVVGEWQYGAIGGFEKVAMTIGACVAIELVLSWFVFGRMPFLQSAYISGVSLTILLRPQGGIIWPFLVGAALSIGSKYALRYRARHLWNPSNFGIACLVLLAPSQVAILSHEMGNDLRVNGIIWVLGLLIASRARILHVSATYGIAFTALAALRSLINDSPLWSELAPITGPMYQLMLFFMLTDPRTSVGTRTGRIVVTATVALVEAGIRLANDFDLPGAELFAPAPPILALAIVGPLALALSLRARSKQASPAQT